MRNRLIGLIGAMVLPSTMSTAGCADYSSGGAAAVAAKDGGTATGGSSAGGGQKSTGGSATATGGAAPSCPSGDTSCGGDLVGTWTVTSSCLTVSGTMNLGPLGADCTSAPITGGSFKVTTGGTLVFDASTYTDNTTTTGSQQIAMPSTCKHLSGTDTTCQRLGEVTPPIFNFEAATSSCVDAASGGGCNCQLTANQTGWAGTVSPSATNNDVYATAGNVLTFNNGHSTTTYAYCVSGSTLTMTPTPATPTIVGTIVFTKS